MASSSIINTVIYGAIGLTVFFLLLATIVLPQFNTAYNTAVTGLSTATLQGMLLLVLVLALVGVGIMYICRSKLSCGFRATCNNDTPSI
jgi:type II secretory pathway component PulF